jgi:phosphate transport system substrate-binding protein
MRALLSAAVALLVAAAATASAQTIRIEGSAAGYGMSRAAAAAFDKTKSIQAGVSGATLGFASLCRGEAQLVQSSRPMQKSEIDACARGNVEFVELPLAFDAVAVIVNPKNSFAGAIAIDELRGAWELKAQGRVIRWSQVNARWPDSPLQLIGPDKLSDESRFITSVLLKGGLAREDYMASTEDRVIVQAVARDPQALGLVSLAYYLQNRGRLKALPVSFDPGQAAVPPSLEAVVQGAYRPLARPVFLYVSARALERPEVQQFAEYYVANAARFAKDESYVPLPPALYKKALANLQGRVKGSMWDGAMPLGLTVDALQKKYGG